jgi:hypothetical protein
MIHSAMQISISSTSVMVLAPRRGGHPPPVHSTKIIAMIVGATIKAASTISASSQ